MLNIELTESQVLELIGLCHGRIIEAQHWRVSDNRAYIARIREIENKLESAVNRL